MQETQWTTMLKVIGIGIKGEAVTRKLKETCPDTVSFYILNSKGEHDGLIGSPFFQLDSKNDLIPVSNLDSPKNNSDKAIPSKDLLIFVIDTDNEKNIYQIKNIANSISSRYYLILGIVISPETKDDRKLCLFRKAIEVVNANYDGTLILDSTMAVESSNRSILLKKQVEQLQPWIDMLTSKQLIDIEVEDFATITKLPGRMAITHGMGIGSNRLKKAVDMAFQSLSLNENQYKTVKGVIVYIDNTCMVMYNELRQLQTTVREYIGDDAMVILSEAESNVRDKRSPIQLHILLAGIKS